MVYKSKRRASEEQTSGAFTPNYKYPTFHTGGSKNNHFVQIGEALKDIDHRLGATGDAKVKVDNIVDATDLGKDILLSADTEDVRDILEVQTVAETKTAIDAAVTTEANTRTAEDARLQTAINNETAARTSADAALQTKIEEETTARTEADATLQTNIDNEAEAREAAVTAEADARTKADDKLTADLAAEVANRTKAVADEQTAREIADQTEAATREKQDAAITAAINTEILDRKNADAALQTKIEEETAARTAADKTLTDNLAKEVSDREAAVSQEATARTDGDANLQTAIDTEKADRTAAVKTVSDAVAKETADRTAAVTAESTARVEADRTLQNNIDAEKAARTEADTTLQNNIDLKADKTALPTKVSELQNDSDFQSGAQVDAKIAEATTTVYNYKGAVNTPDDLPAGSKQNPNKVGDTYNDKSTGMNYVWDGKAWDALGAVTTLTTLGVTATANELNYTDGVTAPIQTQLDAKQTKDDANAFETLVGETYATKTEMTDSLALKQDAATAFDGKYTSLTEVPSQFTPAAHTHAIADVTGLQGALDAKADTSVIPTIPGNATASKAGLMSSEDKTKLDGLNNYVLPEATADVLGGVKVGAGLQIQDGKLTTSTESKTFANPEVIGASETLDLSTATNGVYSINGGSITGLTGSNDTAAALVINAGATHPSAIAFDGAFATDKVLPVCQDGTNWFKLTAMDRAEFVADPVGDTVTKEEFIALRDALVAAGIMKLKA